MTAVGIPVLEEYVDWTCSEFDSDDEIPIDGPQKPERLPGLDAEDLPHFCDHLPPALADVDLRYHITPAETYNCRYLGLLQPNPGTSHAVERYMLQPYWGLHVSPPPNSPSPTSPLAADALSVRTADDTVMDTSSPIPGSPFGVAVPPQPPQRRKLYATHADREERFLQVQRQVANLLTMMKPGRGGAQMRGMPPNKRPARPFRGAPGASGMAQPPPGSTMMGGASPTSMQHSMHGAIGTGHSMQPQQQHSVHGAIGTGHSMQQLSGPRHVSMAVAPIAPPSMPRGPTTMHPGVMGGQPVHPGVMGGQPVARPPVAAGGTANPLVFQGDVTGASGPSVSGGPRGTTAYSSNRSLNPLQVRPGGAVAMSATSGAPSSNVYNYQQSGGAGLTAGSPVGIAYSAGYGGATMSAGGPPPNTTAIPSVGASADYAAASAARTAAPGPGTGSIGVSGAYSGAAPAAGTAGQAYQQAPGQHPVGNYQQPLHAGPPHGGISGVAGQTQASRLPSNMQRLPTRAGYPQ